MERRTRRHVLGVLGGSAIGLSGCLGGENGADNGGTAGESDSGTDEMTAWRSAELTDVTTDEQFSISEFEVPALVHPFAVWCGTCSSQNQELDTLQREREGEREVVQLNIGDGENDDDVLDYAESNEYASHSRFAIAPNDVANALVEEFGPAVVSPPQSPVLLVCSDGSVREIDKVTAAETIASEIETNCG